MEPTLNQPAGCNVFDVQLNYNLNQALDPDFWDSNFYMVSLYRSMEHLASDAKNFKKSLSRMKKYIFGKSIKNSKANNVKDFKGIGKAMWEFISTIYESHWNNLFIDNNKSTFKNKVKSKFNPQVNKPQAPPKGKEIAKPTFVSSLPPPISAKSLKEINKLSKYFKKNINVP